MLRETVADFSSLISLPGPEQDRRLYPPLVCVDIVKLVCAAPDFRYVRYRDQISRGSLLGGAEVVQNLKENMDIGNTYLSQDSGAQAIGEVADK
jgi:hypothetical protein